VITFLYKRYNPPRISNRAEISPSEPPMFPSSISEADGNSPVICETGVPLVSPSLMIPKGVADVSPSVPLWRFTGQVVKILVMIFVIIIVIGKFGISIAPFIAAIGAMIFGASFAIAGPLSNYGAGLVIILTRPFVVGNTISVKGVDGIVEEVSLSTTVLSTEDGERITIPNKHIVGEVLTNSFENKVVEASVGISYNDDPEKAISLIGEVLDATEQVVKDPAPIIGIERYAESSIQIGIRYWIPTRHYFKILYAVNLAIHKKLKQAGITIPFPQLDLHVVEKGSGLKG